MQVAAREGNGRWVDQPHFWNVESAFRTHSGRSEPLLRRVFAPAAQNNVGNEPPIPLPFTYGG